MQPEELGEGQLNNINEGSGCHEKDQEVSEEVVTAQYYRDPLRYFTILKDYNVGS